MMKKNILSFLIVFIIAVPLWAQNETGLFGINRTVTPFNHYLGKIDLNNGQISNCSGALSPGLTGFSSVYTPAIDPIGNRYFMAFPDMLMSIDINTGTVLNTFNAFGIDDIWYMQYNFMDGMLYAISRTTNPIQYFLVKIDPNTGQTTTFPNILPPNFGSFGSSYYPAIDPIGNRYFIVSDQKLWSIDLNNGQVLNTFNLNSYEDLWFMQYDYKDSTLYCINRTSNPLEHFLGKVDLTTGQTSSYQTPLPSDFGGYCSCHSPSIDPIGNRYFIISNQKLWSIDLNTGSVLNSFNVNTNEELWYMQYNYTDSITDTTSTSDSTSQPQPIEKLGAIKVYPNPTRSVINIESVSATDSEYKIRLLDSKGYVLLDQNVGTLQERIDISNLSKGVYFLEVIVNQEKRTEKIIKY